MDVLLQRISQNTTVDEKLKKEIGALWHVGIERISNDKLRCAIKEFFETQVPWQFFISPSSPSGTHHPDHHNERSGLLRHIIETCVLTDRMLRMYGFYDKETEEVFPSERDIVLAATLISDTFKNGNPWQGGTKTNHGEIAANEWLPFAKKHDVHKHVVQEVCRASYWHYGRWTPAKNRKNFQDLPDLVQIVHILDMFSASDEIDTIYNAVEEINIK